MMIHRNLDDVLNQLRAAGLVLETATNGQGGVDVGGVFVESAKSVRCDLASDKKNSRHGAYRLYELRLADGIWITGAYWLDHSATSYKIELRKECDACGADIPLRASACPACQAKRFREREIPAAEIEAHKARMAEARRNAEADARRRADRAAAWADAVWLACREVEPGEHDYLARKQLAGGHGARILAGNDGILLEGADKGDYQYLGQLTGALVVPMCNVAGKRRALQFILSREKHKELIAQRGTDKLYWPVGMTNDGLMAILGEAPAVGGLGLVVEGFATGASLREASGMTVAVAFDAGGVPKVGEALWKSRKKKLHLLYCGDDDWVQRCVGCGKYTPVDDDRCEHCGEPHGKGNAGRAKAKEAAAATSGAWLLPVFATPRQRDKKSISDFNDLRVAEGLQVVGAQIAAKLIDLGWQTPGGAVAPSAGGRSSSGGRGAGGADEVVRPDAVSTLPLDALVERFIHIDDDTGEFVFDTWTRNVCKFSKVTKMLPARVRTDDIKDHPQWRRRAVYIDQIGFDPGGEDKNIVCNRWDGLPKWSTGGSCEILLQLLQHQCSTEAGLAAQQLYDWVIKWLAYPLQHLGAKMQTAILMHGPQGTGKGRFFEAYARIFGDYSVVLDQAALEDKFNSDWQERKLFILADEIVARADMYHIKNRLKNFVTGEWVRVNPKNVAAHRERNHMQIVFLSNEKQPLVLENDEFGEILKI
jgi:putative DNA primase/helicase